MKRKNTDINRNLDEKITRKEALKKAGLSALTASTLFFLETKSAAAQSLDSESSEQRPGADRGSR